MNRNNLHKYQSDTCELMKSTLKTGAFIDMGLGKTTTTLTAISDLFKQNKIKRVLVVGPLRVVNTVWKQEASKWDHLKHLTFSICTGKPKQREKALKENSQILLINRENLQWLATKRQKFDAIIIDESSSFKNPSTKRFKVIRLWCNDAKYVVILTGTPSPNSLLDLWSQVFLLDQGKRLGRTYNEYKNKFFYRTGYMGYELKPIPGALEKITSLISDICVTLKAEDYLQLPEKIVSNIPCVVDKEVMDKYLEFEAESLIEIMTDKITVLSASALSNKLFQYCNGFIYDKDEETGKNKVFEIHSAKIDALKSIIEDNPNENILVAYHFKHDLTMLQREFKDAVILDTDPKIVDKWNSGKIRILLAHPQSAGHGLNLQAGGSIIIWYGLTWALEEYLQFNARLHRQGQTKPVKIFHLVMKGGLDEESTLMALNNKELNQNNIKDRLKRALEYKFL